MNTTTTDLPLEKIRRDSPEPVALQTYRILARAFEEAGPDAGSRLPSERSMAGRIGVSRETLRKALASLRQDGLVESSAQRGWFVPEAPLSEPPNELQSFTEMAAAAGFTVTTVVVERVVRTATLEEATKLGVAPASNIFDILRLRSLNDSPICLDRSLIPVAIAAPILDVDLTDKSLFGMLAEECDVIVSRADFDVAAEPASERSAGLLGVDEGAPLLVGYETTYDQDGCPVLLGASKYRGDAYHFKASLFRP
jgi:GntR family transcriptional regulator